MKFLFELIFGVYSPLAILGFVFRLILGMFKGLITLFRLFKR